MALEDFFTLSEMKDGLTNLVRVEELIEIMENQKESIRSIVGDAARQWSTVANIIAATERKDCLDHFIQLNGLPYLNHWLEEALKQKSEDRSDSFAEELVHGMLGALNRLPIDWEASSVYGIRSTLKQLHESLWRSEKIQDKFRTLTSKWSSPENGNNLTCTPADGEGAVSKEELKFAPLEDPEDQVIEEAKVNDVDDSAGNQKSTDVVVDENKDSGEVAAQCPAVAIPRPSDLVSTEPVLATEAPVSVSPCLSPVVTERRDDDDSNDDSDDDESRSSPREGDAPIDKVDDMDIDVDPKAGSSAVSSPKNTSFVSQEILSGSRRSMDKSSVVGELTRERPEIGMEYGEIDALEVARQVAIEVEREVVDYREPFCSSSPEITASANEKIEKSDAGPDNKKVDDSDDEDDDDDGNNDDDGGSGGEKGSPSEDSTSSSDDTLEDEELASDPMKSPPNSSSIHVEKKRCDFDLNEDFCSEEDNHPTALSAANLSVPVAVAAPKGAPAVPVAPLHFTGELGWRGSAATSAFRPTALTAQRQKSAAFSIDLNVAEGSDDEMAMVNSPETGSRPDKLELDLNRREDDDILPSNFWRPHQQNGVNLCASPASSSSSRQPSLRDFDLNDDPSAFEACGSSSSFLGRSMARNYKFEDSAFMGVDPRLGMERREVTQRSMAYAAMPQPPQGFGYNPAVPILPPFYGPGSMPYMVDSSGAAVVPQILSSAGVPPGSAARPSPFLMSMVGPPPPGLNMMVGGSGRLGLDLNSGGGSAHGESGSFRHVQLGGSGGGSGFVEDRVLKRKEPDWEPPYSIGCKQATSWQ